MGAGYVCWEYGTEKPSGWSRTTEAKSRGDCNYLFSRPSVSEALPAITLAGPLAEAYQRRDHLQNEISSAQQNIEKLQDDVEWLLAAVKEREAKVVGLTAEKRSLEITWEAVQNSAGWRLLNRWRRLRDGLLAPEGTRRRKFYDSLLGYFRGA